jgi:hypothetical protein
MNETLRVSICACTVTPHALLIWSWNIPADASAIRKHGMEQADSFELITGMRLSASTHRWPPSMRATYQSIPSRGVSPTFKLTWIRPTIGGLWRLRISQIPTARPTGEDRAQGGIKVEGDPIRALCDSRLEQGPLISPADAYSPSRKKRELKTRFGARATEAVKFPRPN